MRLYRRGDEGEPVRDIQSRLATLGHVTTDPPGIFGGATEAAVAAFQRERGLASDGIVGPDTWRTMVDAGFSLGDRMLYHRVPMIRGDDVAELQRRLSSLGFDAGKVDGIFGPDTLHAVLDFQSNRRMAEDGIAGREVVDELELMARATAKPGRDGVRERQWLAALPRTIAGQRIYIDAFCRADDESASTWAAALTFGENIQNMGGQPVYSRSADTVPTERVRALRANRVGADFVVAFAEARDGVEGVFYFASRHSHSAAGEKLAAAIASAIGLDSVGRAIPILKDTRPPAVVVTRSHVDAELGAQVASALSEVLAAPREGERSLDDR